MAPRQLRILEALPEPRRKRPAKAFRPQDIGASSEAEAVREIHKLRRSYEVGDHWEVISTDGSYRHVIVLRQDAERTLFPMCIAKECRAPLASPCWATFRVIESKSFAAAVRAQMEGNT